MISKLLLCLLLALPLAAWAANTPPAIDGWGKLKFGMSVQEAINATPDIIWPGEGCTDEGNSCKMKPSQHYVAVISGIGFIPELTFDKFDRLTTISLEHSTFLPGPDCWGRLYTTMAGLEKRYGKFDAPMQEGVQEEKRTAPNGSYYSVERLNLDGSLILLFKTTSDVAAYQTDTANDIAGNSMRAPRPFVSIVGSTSEDSTSSCGFTVYYKAADMPAPKGVPGGDNGEF